MSDDQNRSDWGEHSKTVREFFGALTDPKTFMFHKNLYVLVGLASGLPIPVATWLLISQLEGYGFSFSGVWRFLHREPTYLILIAFPLPFMLFLAALGQVKHKRDRYIAALLHELETNVERLSSANEELRELDKLRDEFTSNITHELKTPLVTIKGYTEMLLSGELGVITDTQQRSLKVILKNIGRLIELIDQILQFRRLATAPLPRQLRPFALRQILTDIEQNFQPQIREGQFDFAVELPNRMVMVVADRPRIERVFTNLVSNALKFTPPGGRIRVRVSEPRNGRVDVAVEDSGSGIPKDAQKHIFDRYRQSDGSVRRRFGGTGLGLAIVKRILQAHGVQIMVESERDKGSTFKFKLPVAMEAIKSGDVPRGTESTRGQGRRDST